MYTDSHAPQIRGQVSAHRPEPMPSASVEERYRQAKARLAAAQQEKLEAAWEFMAARAALGRRMEEMWPGRGESE